MTKLKFFPHSIEIIIDHLSNGVIINNHRQTEKVEAITFFQELIPEHKLEYC